MTENPDQTTETSIGEQPIKDAYAFIRTTSNIGTPAWITIQDLGKVRNLDWGWLDPAGSRAWWSGNYAWGSFYWVTAEVYDLKGGKELYSTIMEVNLQNGSNNIITLNQGRDNYYWELTS